MALSMQVVGLAVLALICGAAAFRTMPAAGAVGLRRTRIPSSVPARDAEDLDARSLHPRYSAEWAAERGLVPGFGGVWPGDPAAKKYSVTLRSKKEPEKEYKLDVPSDRYIFFYFEQLGIDLPVVNKARMCRQGCCTICTAQIASEKSKVEMEAPLGLLKDMRDKKFILTCCTMPRSDLVCELQDEDETYVKQWAEGFEGGGVEWGGVFPDEDG